MMKIVGILGGFLVILFFFVRLNGVYAHLVAMQSQASPVRAVGYCVLQLTLPYWPGAAELLQRVAVCRTPEIVVCLWTRCREVHRSS
jgi:hypothetical protein